MGKVNWVEARLMYVRDSRISYTTIARYYGVSKPTVQAHATKHGWVDLRKEYADWRIDILKEQAQEANHKFEIRQIKYFKLIQNNAWMGINHIVDRMNMGKYTKADMSTLASLCRTVDKAIQQERLVLGIQYKPVKHYLDDSYTGPNHTVAKTDDGKIPTVDEMIEETEKTLRYFKRRRTMMIKSEQALIDRDKSSS